MAATNAATASEASPKSADSVTTSANKDANYDYSYTNPDSPAATAPTIDSKGIQTFPDTQSPAFVHTIYYKDKVSGQDVQAPSVIKVWYTRNPKVPSEHLNDPGATENGGIPYGDWHFHKMTITGSPVETAGTDVQPMTPENTPEMTPKFNRVVPKYGSGKNISTAEQFDFSAPWVGPDLAGYQRLGSTSYLSWNDFVPDKFHNEPGNEVSQTIYYVKEEKTTKQVSQDLTFTLHYKYFDGDKAGQTAAPDKTLTVYFMHEETTIKTPKIENGDIVKDSDGNVEYDTKVTDGQVNLDTTKGDGRGYVTSDGSQWNIADVATHNADGSLKGVLTLNNWSAVPVIDGYVLGSAIVNNEDKIDYPTTVRGSYVNAWGNPLQLNYFSSDNPDYPFNIDHTAYYFQVGKIVPVDENGTPIKGADTPSYPNDPNNPTKVTPNEDTPDVPGYHVDPKDPNVTKTPDGHTVVTPKDPTKNTDVHYVKDDASAKVTYIDDTTGKTLTTVDLNGKAGEPINFTPANDQTKTYENNGYELVSSDIPTVPTDFDLKKDTNGPTQAWTVHLKHGQTTVDGNNPNHPTSGTPINPKGNPKGPKYTPEQTNVVANHTMTVKYTGSDKNPADDVQNSHWTRTVTVDKVTGETVSSTPWTSPDKYKTVKTPVVDGYVADKASVTGKDIPENQTYTVTYTKVGNFVPVDPSGKTIPGTTPQPYKNDPDDPQPR
ncbi:mucin-binding protein [Lactobacillus xujianguonis]|uniref:mucin-binding protein n=1 Tax=Lactobacillus xujianguonis TaxID=2495899 RepID=UPI000FDAEE15|nr:hypothetical protein [Lactobacillus xujianguonis]RVU77634.1 hypothetical protein EJK20_01385 [Lactobacillus xujianguonis]